MDRKGESLALCPGSTYKAMIKKGSNHMKNEIMNIQNIKGVRGYVDADGVVQLNLEDVARGLGFTSKTVSATSGREYVNVRWSRVAKHLVSFGIIESEKDDLPEYIAEPIFYLLSMKAENETARAFQHTIAYEVLPSIRKHGAYMTEDTIEKILDDPDTLIRLATALKEERAKRKVLEQQVNVQQQQIAEMQPKVSYYDVVLNCKDLVAISTIAKDYGWSANKMNAYLHAAGIQYKQGSIWLLYQKYAEQGYTSTKTHSYPSSDGDIHTKTHTYWTQKGRLFIYDQLKADGILPLMEMCNAA